MVILLHFFFLSYPHVFIIYRRTWDFKHLNPTWNFLVELGGKVRALLAIMEHPINMAHLAKLFTAQLVQSCNFDVSISPASGSGVESVLLYYALLLFLLYSIPIIVLQLCTA